MPKSTIQKNYLVTKRNQLNEMRPMDMTLQELRFFSIYLSRINPKDEKTRSVRFSLDDFQNIMELGRLNMAHLRRVIDGLLQRIVGTPDENGTGEIRFQLFKVCRISEDQNSREWYIEIDAHDLALPFMFDFKGHYFRYELWNALRLKSKNQLRMYEILKQYETIGSRVISVKELREQLGIAKDEYLRFGDFKHRVLDSCQHALAEYTDISYKYEPYGKKGPGGKILQLKFIITKNKSYVDPLHLHKFIDISKINSNETDLDDVDENGIVRSTGNSILYEERILHLMSACDNEFSREEVILLYDIMAKSTPHLHTDKWDSYHFLRRKYRELDMRSRTSGVGHRFGYMKTLVKAGDN